MMLKLARLRYRLWSALDVLAHGDHDDEKSWICRRHDRANIAMMCVEEFYVHDEPYEEVAKIVEDWQSDGVTSPPFTEPPYTITNWPPGPAVTSTSGANVRTWVSEWKWPATN